MDPNCAPAGMGANWAPITASKRMEENRRAIELFTAQHAPVRRINMANAAGKGRYAFRNASFVGERTDDKLTADY
jgi:hypothetical protein